MSIRGQWFLLNIRQFDHRLFHNQRHILENALILPKYLLTLGGYKYRIYIISLFINIKYLLSWWSCSNDRICGKTHETPEIQREIDRGSCIEIYWVMSLNNLLSSSSTAFAKDELQLYFITLYFQQYLKLYSATHHVVIW